MVSQEWHGSRLSNLASRADRFGLFDGLDLAPIVARRLCATCAKFSWIGKQSAAILTSKGKEL